MQADTCFYWLRVQVVLKPLPQPLPALLTTSVSTLKTRNTLLLPNQSTWLYDEEKQKLDHIPTLNSQTYDIVEIKYIFFYLMVYLYQATASLFLIWWKDLKDPVVSSPPPPPALPGWMWSKQPHLPTVFSQWQPFSWIKRGAHWFSHCLNLQLNPPDMSRMYCSVNKWHHGWRKAALMLAGEKGKKRMTRQRRGRGASLAASEFCNMPPLLILSQMN